MSGVGLVVLGFDLTININKNIKIVACSTLSVNNIFGFICV